MTNCRRPPARVMIKVAALLLALLASLIDASSPKPSPPTSSPKPSPLASSPKPPPFPPANNIKDTISVPLPSPPFDSSSFTFSIGTNGKIQSMVMALKLIDRSLISSIGTKDTYKGSFSTSLALPGRDIPLPLTFSAVIVGKTTQTKNSTTITLTDTTGPFNFDTFSFIHFDAGFSVSATLTSNYSLEAVSNSLMGVGSSIISLQSLTISGSTMIGDVQCSGSFSYNLIKNSFGFAMSVASIDMQVCAYLC